MKKYFLFCMIFLCSLPLQSMDTLPDEAYFSLMFSSIQVLRNERRIDLADISNVRCVNRAAYCYYSIPEVYSWPQFHVRTDPSAYSMRGSILKYYAKHEKQESFSKLWYVDHTIRNVGVSLLGKKKVKKTFVLKSYKLKKAMDKYRKYSCDESELQKKRFQLLLLTIGRKAGRSKQVAPVIVENFKAANFNIFDVMSTFNEKEKVAYPYMQDIFSAIVRKNHPELLLAVMGSRIDPRSFFYIAKLEVQGIISFLLKNCFNDFFTVDADGRGLFHYMCEHLNNVFIHAFIEEAIVQKCTVDLQLQDCLGNSPLDLLWAHKYNSDRRKKNEILAYLESYSGIDLNITESEGSNSSSAIYEVLLGAMVLLFSAQR